MLVPRHAANQASAYEEVTQSRSWELHPPAKGIWASQQVNAIVEIEGVGVKGLENVNNIYSIAWELDPQKTYRIKVTHLGCRPTAGLFETFDGGVFQFEGLWLDRPVSAPRDTLRATNATGSRTLGELRPPTRSPYFPAQGRLPAAMQKSPVIELVTSERPLRHSQLADAHQDQGTALQERISTWYNLLGMRLSADIAMVPTGRSRLVATDITQTTIKNLFFRAGPEESTHILPRRWSFGTYQPAVLVLQFGLTDFDAAYRKTENNAARDKFKNDFVNAYVGFVKAIRSNAYPLPKTSRVAGSPDAMEDDGSYVYNSAPSTLPIFLIAPFSSCRIFLGMGLTMNKIITDALREVAEKLHKDGDYSTLYVDTSGWLDPKHDFDIPKGIRIAPVDGEVLTPDASDRVASILTDHLCPYLKGLPEGATNGPALGGCAFEPYDNYLGNVYVPNDVGLDRALLERKIENVKARFEMAWETVRDTESSMNTYMGINDPW